MRTIALIAVLLASPAVAAAPAKHHARPAAPPPSMMLPTAPPDFGAMLSVMDKLFPAQPDPDPARLALARSAVTPMWPDGAYGKMMSSFMGRMFDQAMQLKKSDLDSAIGGPAKASATDASVDLSVHDQALAKDPNFDRRIAAIRAVATDEMTKVSAIIDPRMRDGLARSMARRFDAQQLADINAFFATPSGRALASNYIQLFVDPDTIRSLFQSLPEMMKLMPEMMDRMKAASDQFPVPPKTAGAAKH
jgi:hypothetical protein